MNAPPAEIEIAGLGYRHRGSADLFTGLNLTLRGGQICGLLGRNGAGKTTLLELLVGARRARSGSLGVLGMDPAKRHPDFLKELFFLPDQMPALRQSPREIAHLQGRFYPRFQWELMERLLGEFQVSATQKLTSMSLGEAKKAWIAFALATRVSLYLFDEPTNGLDIPSKAQFRRILAQVLTERQQMILSTHQIRDLGELLDEVVILESGRILLQARLCDLAEKISCGFSSSPPTDTVLFSEPAPGGYRILQRGGQESQLDLELLFNALLAQPELMSQVLTSFEKEGAL